MSIKSCLPLILVAPFIFASCSSDEPGGNYGNNGEFEKVDFKKIEMTAADVEAAHAEQAFGIKFLAGMAEEKKATNYKKNFAVSPLSATICMSMLANSTTADTYSSIVNMLGYTDLDALNSFNAKLLDYLPVYNDVMKLALANNVWFSNKYPSTSAEYTTKMTDIFKATPSSVDFSKSSTVDALNNWADANTFGMIPTIVEDIDPKTNMMMANALYFKSCWEEKFDVSNTVDGTFNSANGPVTTPLMSMSTIAAYYEADGVKVLTLPFKNNRAYMQFVLPPEGTDILDYVANMTYSDFQKMNDLKSQKAWIVKIALPRFKSTSNVALNSTFEKMGVSTMGMDIAPTGIGNGAPMDAIISHFTAIDVNEEGAEAAAVTLTAGYTSPNVTRKTEFIADRPFAYFIVEEATGSILMAGVVQDPTQKD